MKVHVWWWAFSWSVRFPDFNVIKLSWAWISNWTPLETISTRRVYSSFLWSWWLQPTTSQYRIYSNGPNEYHMDIYFTLDNSIEINGKWIQLCHNTPNHHSAEFSYVCALIGSIHRSTSSHHHHHHHRPPPRLIHCVHLENSVWKSIGIKIAGGIRNMHALNGVP